MSHKKTYLFLGAAIIVVIAALSVVFYSSDKASSPSNKTATNSEGSVAGVMTQDEVLYAEALAKHLSEVGMVMYGAYWCRFCDEQKTMFGDAWKYIDYVECDAKGENGNPDECLAQGIEGYPAWIFQGEKYSGVQTFDELADISGFVWEQ